jgi:small subunit ribosomal protein S20
LAHSRSALKRWRQSIERRDRNRSTKSRTRTLLTHALAAIGSEPEAAEEAVRAAVSALDKAAQKGVIHANAAARGKSRLLKRFNLAQAESVAAGAAASSTPAKEAPKAPARGRRAATPKASAPRATRGKAADKPAADKAPSRSRTRKTS